MTPIKPTVIRPPSRWAPVRLSEVWAFRDLLLRFTIRDLKLRYKQTVLGVIWVVLQPLLSAGVFSFVFGTVADLPSDGVPYFAFSYVGMIAWTAFAQSLTKISGSLVGNSQLISKIFFPRIVLPLSTIGSTLVDIGVALLLGAVVVAVSGVGISWTLLTFPLWLLLALMIAAGVGLVAASLMVQYRDVGYVLPVATQLLLYATPIAYSLDAVPEDARIYLQANPLTGVLEGFRWAVLQTPAPSAAATLWSVLASLAVLTIGVFVFSAKERGFADVI